MRDFNDFYEEVLKNDEKELEELRKKENAKMLSICLAIFLAVIMFSFLPTILAIIIMVIFIIFCFSIFKSSKNYVTEFKDRIIKKMITEFEEFDMYTPNGRIPNNIYKMAEFESYMYYNSEDRIDGKILGKYPISLAEVHTEDESTDSDGNRIRTTVFHGIFAHISMPTNIRGYVKIHSDKGFLGKVFGNKNKIEMDSSDFEKKFDIYATDKIVAMQVLTSDVMDRLINFMDLSKIKYEMTVINGNIFIRFKTGAMFEPKIVKRSLDYNTLKRYYDILEFIIEVSKEIIIGIERL